MPTTILAIAFVVMALTGCGRFDGEALVNAHNGVLLLDSEPRYGQTFLAGADRIEGVDLLLATFGGRVDGTLTVRLRDGVDGPLLASAELEGSALEDNRWAAARFSRPVPAPDTAFFDLTWEGGQSLGIYANVTPPDVTPGEVERGERLLNHAYSGGQLVRDGVRAPGDLAFHVRGGDPWQVPRTLGRATAHTGRTLLGTPLFLAGWLALLAGSTALMVRRSRPAGDQPALAASQLGQRGPGEQHAQGGERGDQQP
ncbi:MAG: hypothetical protein GEU81_14455, partial [Nitriliruptorales bacterium]|nr:hypothetical protein [Nitriliruptorales bacterium]